MALVLALGYGFFSLQGADHDTGSDAGDRPAKKARIDVSSAEKKTPEYVYSDFSVSEAIDEITLFGKKLLRAQQGRLFVDDRHTELLLKLKAQKTKAIVLVGKDLHEAIIKELKNVKDIADELNCFVSCVALSQARFKFPASTPQAVLVYIDEHVFNVISKVKLEQLVSMFGEEPANKIFAEIQRIFDLIFLVDAARLKSDE